MDRIAGFDSLSQHPVRPRITPSNYAPTMCVGPRQRSPYGLTQNGFLTPVNRKAHDRLYENSTQALLMARHFLSFGTVLRDTCPVPSGRPTRMATVVSPFRESMMTGAPPSSFSRPILRHASFCTIAARIKMDGLSTLCAAYGHRMRTSIFRGAPGSLASEKRETPRP